MAIPINTTPTKAWDIIQNTPSALLIDIRSSMEFLFVGHPTKSIHISWIDEPDWEINPDFVKLIQYQVDKKKVRYPNDEIPIFLICRSGVRSMEAGKLLLEHDFNSVHNVMGGFEGDKDEFDHRSTLNGWRHDGLPWEQC